MPSSSKCIYKKGKSVGISRIWDFQGDSVVKKLLANAGDKGDTGLIPGSGRSDNGNGIPLKDARLGNPMDRGAWRAIVYGVATKWLKHLSHEDRKVAKFIPKENKREGIIKIVSKIDEI